MSGTTKNRKAAASLRELLVGLIDYAGLFPPASLDMQTAVTNYARYRVGEHAWMLGRFVVSASRLDEFESVLNSEAAKRPWHISALVADPAHEMQKIVEFNARQDSRYVVDTVELKAATTEDVSQARIFVHRSTAPFFEIEPAKTRALLPAIAEANARAKIRTGGITPEMFPSSAAIAEFISDCMLATVPFKATAGLHHPIRCVRPLTYEANAPTGVMHGFVNVFVAATLAYSGAACDRVVDVLAEENAREFEFTDDGISWRDARVKVGVIKETREHFAASFGSCSFEEPVADLQVLGLL